MTRFLLLVALSVCSGGCESSTGPANIVGAYMLTAVDSLDLPHLVFATSACDEVVVRGDLQLANDESFLLSVTQTQDCTRAGATVDTFTTITSGVYSANGRHLIIDPAGTGIELTGSISPGAIDLQLPPLPLAGGAHSGSFLIFPL